MTLPTPHTRTKPYSADDLFPIELASQYHSASNVKNHLFSEQQQMFDWVMDAFDTYIEPSNRDIETFISQHVEVNVAIREQIIACRKLVFAIRRKEKNLKFLSSSGIQIGYTFKDVLIGSIKYSTCVITGVTPNGQVEVTATRRGKAERYLFELDVQTLQFWRADVLNK